MDLQVYLSDVTSWFAPIRIVDRVDVQGGVRHTAQFLDLRNQGREREVSTDHTIVGRAIVILNFLQEQYVGCKEDSGNVISHIVDMRSLRGHVVHLDNHQHRLSQKLSVRVHCNSRP